MSTQLITEDCGGRHVWWGRRSKGWQQSGRGNNTIKYEVSAYYGSDTGPGNNRVARYSRVPAALDLSLAGGGSDNVHVTVNRNVIKLNKFNLFILSLREVRRDNDWVLLVAKGLRQQRYQVQLWWGPLTRKLFCFRSASVMGTRASWNYKIKAILFFP